MNWIAISAPICAAWSSVTKESLCWCFIFISPRPELYSTDHHNVADGVTALPQDYAGIPHDVPKLGPPLPGDFGRPVVTTESQSTPIGLDAEQQRANQETEAARTSKVFAPITAPVAPSHASSQETVNNTAS